MLTEPVPVEADIKNDSVDVATFPARASRRLLEDWDMIKPGRFCDTPPKPEDAFSETAMELGKAALKSTLPVPEERVIGTLDPDGTR